MPDAVLALVSLMAGVLVDQGFSLWRDARQHRRDQNAAITAEERKRTELLESAIHRLENTVAGNSGLLKGILTGRIDRLELPAHLDPDDEH